MHTALGSAYTGCAEKRAQPAWAQGALAGGAWEGEASGVRAGRVPRVLNQVSLGVVRQPLGYTTALVVVAMADRAMESTTGHAP